MTNKGPLAAYCPSQLVSQETKIAGTQKLRHNLTRALKSVVQAPLKERERVYVWDVPEWEWKAPSVESARYSAGAELSMEEMLLSINPIKVNKIFRQALVPEARPLGRAYVESDALPTVELLTHCSAFEAELS